MLTPSDKAMHVKQVYSELDRKFEEQETERKAAEQNLEYINLYGFPVDTQALSLIPKATAETLGVVIFYKEGRNLKLGLLRSSEQINSILKQLEAQGYFVKPYLISVSSINHVFEEYSKTISIKHKVDSINLLSQDFEVGSLKELASKFSTVSATEIIEQILGAALHLDASDVHLEPEAGDLKVRFRIDGVLQDAAALHLDLFHQIVSRIKILSRLKLNVTTTPQDGSFSLTYDKIPIDIRVSVIPSAFGESVVMRVLRQDKGSLQFEELGIIGLAQERLLHEMEKPNGMILTTGPTGSGKTTTLYAMLNKLNAPGVKIITLEDPVEYKIVGITQTPIDARAGMTFAAGLRAILRQDPDIVMVGEMRDLETAEIGCQAALTGHIVLSTLHTNDGPSAIPRLLDLGVKPFVLAPAINAIIGQRLVRKICTSCKQEYKLPGNLQSRVEMILKAIPKASNAEVPKKLVFYHSPGCSVCKGLGYKGRMGVYEVFTISDEIEKLITKGATTTEIKNQAIFEGMLTMAQDGILKALQGITDIEEVFRVTEE
jgi:type II secretory ATPase GspE/PulE/Tfp pilus assembly ATPase PilB-like protein